MGIEIGQHTMMADGHFSDKIFLIVETVLLNRSRIRLGNYAGTKPERCSRPKW
jgi:hypothetical protein